MKTILRYSLIFLSLIFLIGCSPKEMTKTYYKEADSDTYFELKIYYKEKSDVIDKQETRTTFKNVNDNYKNDLKGLFEKDKEKFTEWEALDFKIEENGKEMTVIFIFDYTKLDINKAVSEKILPEKSLSEDKKSISLKKVEENLKDLEWKEKIEP